MVNAFRTHAPFSCNASQHTAALVKEYKKGLNKEMVGTKWVRVVRMIRHKINSLHIHIFLS